MAFRINLTTLVSSAFLIWNRDLLVKHCFDCTSHIASPSKDSTGWCRWEIERARDTALPPGSCPRLANHNMCRSSQQVSCTPQAVFPCTCNTNRTSHLSVDQSCPLRCTRREPRFWGRKGTFRSPCAYTWLEPPLPCRDHSQKFWQRSLPENPDQPRPTTISPDQA